MHWRTSDQRRQLAIMLRGFYQYFAIPYSTRKLWGSAGSAAAVAAYANPSQPTISDHLGVPASLLVVRPAVPETRSPDGLTVLPWRISVGARCGKSARRVLRGETSSRAHAGSEGTLRRKLQPRPGSAKATGSRLVSTHQNARRQGRIIAFIDESGLSERPTQVRGWAPRGHTPVLQYHFNWHQLSVIAAITFWRFYFRLFAGSIKGPQIIEFLHALGHQIRRPLLVIWDGLPAHRSALVREYLESLNGAVQIEQLPAYAPELNPTEYIWGHLKHHELANSCAQTFDVLKTHARNRLRSMQRRPTLIRAFWQQAELPL
jgi:transposase